MSSIICPIDFNIYYYIFTTIFKCNIYISRRCVEKKLTFNKLHIFMKSDDITCVTLSFDSFHIRYNDMRI